MAICAVCDSLDDLAGTGARMVGGAETDPVDPWAAPTGRDALRSLPALPRKAGCGGWKGGPSCCDSPSWKEGTGEAGREERGEMVSEVARCAVGLA
jgi:hypothetical protein